MALVIEDGTGVPNANSYADLTFAASYFAALGNTEWTGDDASLELSMSVGCRALEQLYGPELKSKVADSAQERLFPRATFVDNLGRVVNKGTVPACWKEAQCEIALKHLLQADVFPSEVDPAVKSFSFSAGEYSESTDYAGAVRKEKFVGFGKVERLLKPILREASGNWRLRA